MANRIDIETNVDTGTETERYPKRKRLVASHLDDYVLDYNSDDDMTDNEDDPDYVEGDSEASISDSEIPSNADSSMVSYMDQSTKKHLLLLVVMELFGQMSLLFQIQQCL